MGLRKVFCSIKGYYFQAEIKGQTVTWVIPHSFGFVQPAEVDMRLMSIFVEFYTCVLGFVNYRLFHSLNLAYPPKLSMVTEAGEADMEDRVGALNQSLQRTIVEDEETSDVIDNIAVADEEKMKEAVLEREMKEKQSNLFKGLKFFLGREVPKEPLVFMIRAVGGEVSWDSSVGMGATFSQSDGSITHQVMDRDPNTVGEMLLGRFYIQPQWIFDSINRREKCREKDYVLGETLPPHLSPFVSEMERRVGDYVPPEQKALEEGKVQNLEDEDRDEEDNGNLDDEEEDSGNEEEDEEDEKTEKSKGMGVQVGMMEKLDDDHERKMEEDEEYKLRVMMIKKKHRNLYRSMMKNRRKRMNESKLKEKKRKEWDEENTPKSKKKKIQVSASS